MSWRSRDRDSHEVEPIYFDFITYGSVINLSMGMIASFDPGQVVTPHAAAEAATPNERIR
jgi:hypothetical protein